MAYLGLKNYPVLGQRPFSGSQVAGDLLHLQARQRVSLYGDTYRLRTTWPWGQRKTASRAAGERQ